MIVCTCDEPQDNLNRGNLQRMLMSSGPHRRRESRPLLHWKGLLFIARQSWLYQAAPPGAAQRARGIAQAVTLAVPPGARPGRGAMKVIIQSQYDTPAQLRPGRPCAGRSFDWPGPTGPWQVDWQRHPGQRRQEDSITFMAANLKS